MTTPASPSTPSFTTPLPSIHSDPTAASVAEAELAQAVQQLEQILSQLPGQIIEGVLNAILNALGLGAFTGDVDSALQNIENGLGSIFRAVAQLQQLISSLNLSGLGSDFSSLVSGIISALDGSGSGVAGAISALEGIDSDFTSLFSGIINAVKGAGSGLESDVSGAVTAVEDLVGSLFGAGNTASGPVEASVLPPALGGSNLVADLESMATQLFGSATSTGTVQAAAVAALPASQIKSASMGTDMQSFLDGAANALNGATAGAGQDASALISALAGIPGAIVSALGGVSGPASNDAAGAALSGLNSSVLGNSAAIAALSSTSSGYSESVSLQPPAQTVFSNPGTFTYSLPSWFQVGVDILDAVLIGGGNGGSGSGAHHGSAGGASSITINGTVHQAAGGSGDFAASGNDPREGSGTFVYGAVTYGSTSITAPGSGGNGAAGINGFDGLPGTWAGYSVAPTTGTVTVTVGAGGAAGLGVPFSGSPGQNGIVYVTARKGAVPSQFTQETAFSTSVGTVVPYVLNTGVALTDAMTSSAVWATSVSPVGLIIRGNSNLTEGIVALLTSETPTITNYSIGYWNGTTLQAINQGAANFGIAANAWSLSSDNAGNFTIAVNNVPIQTFPTGTTYPIGASNRCGGWLLASAAAAPDGLTAFSFYDAGTSIMPFQSAVTTAISSAPSSGVYASISGPAVTVTVPQSGIVSVSLYCNLSLPAGVTGKMSFGMTGANSKANGVTVPADEFSIGGEIALTSSTINCGATFVLTGLTPGTTTFTAWYSGATAAFSNRQIAVWPWTG